MITALVGTGLDNNKFTYYGFIPKKKSDKIKLYKELENENKTSIIFDTPHNLKNTIADFKKYFSDRKLCIARELTKKFEEYILEDISKISIEEITLKGEFVLLLSGKKQSNNLKITDYEDEIKNQIDQGISTKDIVKNIKKTTDFSKNEIYEYVLYLNK